MKHVLLFPPSPYFVPQANSCRFYSSFLSRNRLSDLRHMIKERNSSSRRDPPLGPSTYNLPSLSPLSLSLRTLENVAGRFPLFPFPPRKCLSLSLPPPFRYRIRTSSVFYPRVKKSTSPFFSIFSPGLRRASPPLSPSLSSPP